MDFTLLLPSETQQKAEKYFQHISNGLTPGFKFSKDLSGFDKDSLAFDDYLEILFNTKLPQIFAESAIIGDGSDWNLEELSILGDISVAMPVSIYDNGNHNVPVVHDKELSGHLIYTPGALLRNDYNFQAADYEAVTTDDTWLWSICWKISWSIRHLLKECLKRLIVKYRYPIKLNRRGLF